MSALAAIAALCSTLVFASPALAQPDDCARRVIDNSKSELLSGRDGKLQEQLSRLSSLGANVFVHFEENMAGGGDAYFNAELTRCNETLAEGGTSTTQLRENAILLAYGASIDGDYTHREAVLYVGKHWTDKGINDDETLKIRTDVMRPTLLKFNHNDAATYQNVPDGLTAGLQRVADDIEHGVPSGGIPSWVWVIVVVLLVAVIVAAIVAATRRRSGGAGRSYGGGGHSTYVSSWGSSSSSDYSASSGTSGGSTDC